MPTLGNDKLDHLQATPSLQEENAQQDIECRLLIELCGILFASSRQLQRLTMHTEPVWDYVYLPSKFITLSAMASTLETLIMVLPESRNFETLAEAVHSLQKLKVWSIALHPATKHACVHARLALTG